MPDYPNLPRISYLFAQRAKVREDLANATDPDAKAWFRSELAVLAHNLWLAGRPTR